MLNLKKLLAKLSNDKPIKYGTPVNLSADTTYTCLCDGLGFVSISGTTFSRCYLRIYNPDGTQMTTLNQNKEDGASRTYTAFIPVFKGMKLRPESVSGAWTAQFIPFEKLGGGTQ